MFRKFLCGVHDRMLCKRPTKRRNQRQETKNQHAHQLPDGFERVGMILCSSRKFRFRTTGLVFVLGGKADAELSLAGIEAISAKLIQMVRDVHSSVEQDRVSPGKRETNHGRQPIQLFSPRHRLRNRSGASFCSKTRCRDKELSTIKNGGRGRVLEDSRSKRGG